MSCIIQSALCFLSLASILVRHCGAGPTIVAAMTNNGEPETAEEPGNTTVITQQPTYPEIKARLKRRLEFSFRRLAQEWPVLLKYWDRKFNTEQEACANVTSLQQQENGCLSGYTCDYDAGRYPSTLIRPVCRGTANEVACTAPGSTSGSCVKKEQYLTVAKFHVQDDSLQPALSPAINSNHELKGKWKRQLIIVTTNCFCKP